MDSPRGVLKALKSPIEASFSTIMSIQVHKVSTRLTAKLSASNL